MKIMMDKQREPSIRHYTHSIQISVTIHVNQNRTQLMFDRYKTSVMLPTFSVPLTTPIAFTMVSVYSPRLSCTLLILLVEFSE